MQNLAIARVKLALETLLTETPIGIRGILHMEAFLDWPSTVTLFMDPSIIRMSCGRVMMLTFVMDSF